MKRIALTVAALASSTPVWAHDGAHLHPHGTELTPVLAVLAVLASAYVFFRAR
ncbi:hypothetical protein KMP13_09480 [Epibacterium ulvae]|uniref:hypothetical protein n=1 Tax=Epibacterium ulvae TaxID=1156985 RepID=UPI001BFC73F2|nr:hypothetical protein [Epibacterium ulvae]MBT8154121.1 hypothetical protein [Epibacterium ulvae]